MTLPIAEPVPPRVTVVVPAFNVADFVEQSVRSALDQTFADLEVIVVDDGSTDGTRAVVEAIRDPRLRILRRRNGGSAAARNSGLSEARGEYVAFLDGDDYWQPRMLERHLALLIERPDIDLVFSLSRIVSESGRELGLLKPGTHRTFSFPDLLIENPIGNGSATVCRRRALEIAGPFDQSLPACVDYDIPGRAARARSRAPFKALSFGQNEAVPLPQLPGC